MPVETVYVRAVHAWADVQGRPFTVYTIKTETMTSPHVNASTVTTINPFKASLCKEAMHQRKPIRMEWRDFKRGARDLVTVEVLEQVA